jgi:hypothetical protein
MVRQERTRSCPGFARGLVWRSCRSLAGATGYRGMRFRVMLTGTVWGTPLPVARLSCKIMYRCPLVCGQKTLNRFESPRQKKPPVLRCCTQLSSKAAVVADGRSPTLLENR